MHKGHIMEKNSYIMQQLINVCPFPANDQPHFLIQIKSFDGRSTKWINITPDQFRQIEKVLIGIND